MTDVNSLRMKSDPRLDAGLAGWRATRNSGRLSGTTLPAELQDLARSAEALFDWSDAKARNATPSKDIREPASAGGPAGLYALAEKTAQSAIGFDEASKLAKELAVGDDDVMFLVVFSAKSQHADGNTAGAMMQLAAMTLDDDAVAAKLCRTLAAMSSNAEYQSMMYQLADMRLAFGANDALRAEIWNETAILLAGQGRYEEARNRADAARSLAQSSGASQIASMALGNKAWVLMQEQDYMAALRAFEELAREQEAAGDHANLDITRQNIGICRQQLFSA
jgi:tetratricopeptide (TPR) repeat protein